MNPGYYAIIPADVRYDVKLKPNAKLLYGEITALSGAQGFCWAQNEYFAALYEVNPKTISRWISQLESRGYIGVKINKTDGNKRKITLVTKKSLPSDKKVTTLVTKKSLPSDKKVTSLYRINNTINNTVNNIQTAFGFLTENYPSRIEQDFLMRFEKEFKDEGQFNSFLEDFNLEVESQKREFDDALIPVLVKYAKNWLAYRKDKGFKVVRNDENLQRPEFKRIG